MAQQSDAPKRRGRPRLNDDERKRHTMTFRMRDDLRAAVEELAQANGRSLSEQIEYYVEACVSTEIGLIYQYDTNALSPVLQKCSMGSPRTGMTISFPSGHTTTVAFGGEPHPLKINVTNRVPIDPKKIDLEQLSDLQAEQFIDLMKDLVVRYQAEISNKKD